MRCAPAGAARIVPRRGGAVVDWRLIWHCATTGGVPRRAFGAALVVGILLSLINQRDALWGHGRIDWLKLVLTFMVPYGVATYGAVATQLPATRRGAPPS
jgi:hypothetical protein